ncbi:unnamed protein product [Amoebophrya sp. A120]|nr:unnamed protein product [Amoebophrya sp. A120]|eukprot:GSA120T00016165001.1
MMFLKPHDMRKRQSVADERQSSMFSGSGPTQRASSWCKPSATCKSGKTMLFLPGGDALLAGGSSSSGSSGSATASGTTAASSTSSSTLLSASAGSSNSKDFSNIGRAMYTLLRIVTLDDWVSTIKGVTEPAVSWNSTALLELRELQGADVGEVIFMPGSQVEEQQSDYVGTTSRRCRSRGRRCGDNEAIADAALGVHGDQFSGQ